MHLTKATTAEAIQGLALISNLPRHRFWPDTLSHADVSLRGVLGHRQVTDAYLAGLARHHGGKLATFDRGLGALHADVAVALDM